MKHRFKDQKETLKLEIRRRKHNLAKYADDDTFVKQRRSLEISHFEDILDVLGQLEAISKERS